jgi:hypothetical protein
MKVDEPRELLKGVPDHYDVVIESQKGDKVAPILRADTGPISISPQARSLAFVLQCGYWW